MDQNDKNFFAGWAILVASNVIATYIITAFGSTLFPHPDIVPTIILGFTMSLFSLIIMWALIVATFLTFFRKVNEPGIVIPLLLGIISGTVGIWLTANLLPQAISLANIWEGLLFSLINTPITAALLLLVFPKMRTKQLWPSN